MRSTNHVAAATLLTAIFLAACSDGDDRPDPVDADRPQPQQPVATPSTVESPPDTTAAALWAHLESEAYRDNWELWPGTDRLYEGTEPHGMLLTTYVNDLANEALAGGGVEDLPEGSIIVKENYMPDSTFDAATVMVKVDGYVHLATGGLMGSRTETRAFWSGEKTTREPAATRRSRRWKMWR